MDKFELYDILQDKTGCTVRVKKRPFEIAGRLSYNADSDQYRVWVGDGDGSWADVYFGPADVKEVTEGGWRIELL